MVDVEPLISFVCLDEQAAAKDKLESVILLEQAALQLQPSIQVFSGCKGTDNIQLNFDGLLMFCSVCLLLVGDREYLEMEELLTRTLLDLDKIDTEGNEQLRSARKNAVLTVQSLIGSLDAKVK